MSKKETLGQVLGSIFAAEFDRVMAKEIAEDGYLNQEDFNSCMERAVAGIEESITPVKNALCYVIAKHEVEIHPERVDSKTVSVTDELSTVSASIDTDNLEKLNARAWWQA